MSLNTARGALAVALASVFGLGVAAADTIRVPADQPTIQDAIGIAVNGDSVLVAPGTYVENIDFLGKAITVESEQGADATVVDGGGIDTVVIFSSGESRSATLRGFTVTNGGGALSGGGIRISGSSPTIEQNKVTRNVACRGAGIMVETVSSALIRDNEITSNNKGGCSGGIGGGGIGISGTSTVEILNNLIADNNSSDGAGISMFAAGDPLISGNEIRGNNASGDGGAISMVNRSDALIEQNLIYDNSAIEGGGVWWLVPSGVRGPRLVFNTIVDNRAGQGAGVYADGFDIDAELVNNIIAAPAGRSALYCGSFNNLDPPMLRFNNVFAAGGPPYDGSCADQTGTSGNISADPLFADRSVGDYRLIAGSPAIDAATDQPSVSKDFLSNARLIDGDGDLISASDLGVYEAHPPAADAGADTTVAAGSVVALDASASSDIDGVIESYDWTGTVVTLNNPQSATPTFTAPATAATLTFQVTVTDDLGFESADEVTVTVDQPPPPPDGNADGCTIGPTDGTADPTLPLLLLFGLAYLSTRRLQVGPGVDG